MIDPGLAGKVVVVTGANNPQGIGAGIAKAFGEQRAKVFLHYFRDRRENTPAEEPSSPGEPFYRFQQARTADDVVAAIRALGAEADSWEGDLSEPSTVEALFDRAEAALGPVEILINNAACGDIDTFLPPGIELVNKLVETWSGRAEAITPDRFDRTFAVNARATALAMAGFARRHIARGATWGRIINISTDGAECFPSEATYGASKAALESYSRTAATELGKLGITVNVLSLGPVQTGWINRELEEQVLPSIPVGRVGTPKDVGDAAVFFASVQAGWITGQRIYVGGGHAM